MTARLLSKEVLGDKMEVANAGLISQEAFDALRLELHLGKRAVGLDAERKAVLLASEGEAGGSEASKAAEAEGCGKQKVLRQAKKSRLTGLS